MSSLTFLLLSSIVSPVEDALVLHLGDDDFHKRETTTEMVHRVLQNTDGCQNYSLLVKVKKASESNNPEIKRRASRLYASNRPRYFREYPYMCVFFDNPQTGKDAMPTTYRKMKKIAETEGYKMERWGSIKVGKEVFFICATPKDFGSDRLNKLKANKEVIRIVSVTYPLSRTLLEEIQRK